MLCCQAHETWSRFFGATLEDRSRYGIADCFETFPFPPGFETDPRLEAAGEAYYRFRADLMVRNNEGLTKTYNRFHDPAERSGNIAELRRLHEAMDRAVLDAYGWGDIATACEFELEWEDEGAERVGRGGGSLIGCAGPSRSATRCWPACWRSTRHGRRRSASGGSYRAKPYET